MIRKIGILFLCVILGQLGYSCTSCWGEDTDPLPYYDVTGYVFGGSSRVIGTDNTGRYLYEPLPENEIVDYNKLAMSVRASVEYYAAAKPGAFFFSTAYACDPMPNGYKGTKELLESIQITSSYDFDENHPQGTSLNDLFDVYGGAEWVSSLNDFLAQDELQAPTDLGLMLNARPTASETQKFIISFYLSTGEVYTTESGTLTIR